MAAGPLRGVDHEDAAKGEPGDADRAVAITSSQARRCVEVSIRRVRGLIIRVLIMQTRSRRHAVAMMNTM